MFKKTLISLAVASSLGLTGCFDSAGSGSQNANPEPKVNNPDIDGKTWPVFNPITSEVPIPSDLNFDQEAQDGSFGIDGDETNPVIGALNKLSGASTVAPAVVRMSGDIDIDSVDSRAFIPNPAFDPEADPQTELPVIPNPNQNVFLIELAYASGEPVRALSAGEPPTIPLAVTFQLAAGQDPLGTGEDLQGRNREQAIGYLMELAESPAYDHDVVELNGDSAIRVRPNTPLNPLSRYVVVVTDGIEDVNGDAIVGSPSYQNLGEEDEPLGNNALAPVKTLITGFWENISTNYFALNNSSREGAGLAALGKDNIALSYSFTTSEDKKVLSHIANPANWISDQLERQVKVGAAGLRAAAATVFEAQASGEPSGLDPERFGLPETATDEQVQAAVVAALGKDPENDVVEPSDFLRPGNDDPTSFGFGDTSYFVQVATSGFTPSEVLGSDFGDCDALDGKQKFDCVGATAEAGFGIAGIEFPIPEARDFGIDSTNDALSVSAVLSSLDVEAGDIDVHQGFIELPQYISVPDANQTGPTSSIRTQSWQPDSGLAAILGDQLDATIPQEDSDVSSVLNYNFPFPTLQDDVRVPMLVITPNGENPADDSGTPLIPVIFQHGITTDRSAALAFGTQLVASAEEAGLSLAVFAIDQPLHGVSPFTLEDQESLALTLLVQGGVVDQPELDDEGNPIVTPETQATIDTVIAGEFPAQILTAIALGLEPLDASPDTPCEDARFDGMPDGAGGTVSGERSFDEAVGNVLAGQCDDVIVGAGEDPVNAPALGLAFSLDTTVANAGSTIPGLEPANTATGYVEGEINERHYGYTADPDNNPMAMDFEEGVGSSGSLFINLTNFLNSRDILRQGSIDLMNLAATINGMDGVTGNGVNFVGHSLGTLNGGAFVGAATASGNEDLLVASSHLLTPVAGTTRLLENSPSFAPTILGGLQVAAGLSQGDADLETFLNVNQATLDAVDPINFANELAVSNTVLAQVEGDRTTPNAADTRYGEDKGPLDITFPNGLRVQSPAAPLSGSEALALIMGAKATEEPLDTPMITRYETGVHGTPVLPQEEIAEPGDVLKDRTIAAGGEVIVSTEDAQTTFGTMIEQTIQLIGTTIPD
ncbi:hypothetical protein [Marinobacter sp. HL-58]|uniref:hypothetical protein n=1 Tax=Marinobacter sp. HL-58 TaxID=1479237 RepID=UPI000484FFE3|nr:hypothetical protein [Marinobacter sp. HL-58]KPP97881.1 MAG: Pla-1/cef family extracellular lipase [Marinobacter sp. HL-58]